MEDANKKKDEPSFEEFPSVVKRCFNDGVEKLNYILFGAIVLLEDNDDKHILIENLNGLIDNMQFLMSQIMKCKMRTELIKNEEKGK